MGLLSWRGKGWIGFVVIFGSVFLAIGADELRRNSNLFVMGLGFLAGGIAMRVLGKRWNTDGPRHQFCEMRVERWIFVFAPIGAFLMLIGIPALRYS